MARIQFQLGGNDRLFVNLPSHAPGRSDVLSGRAKIRVGSLVCSRQVSFSVERLAAFFADVRRVHDALRDEFSLASEDGAFSVTGHATATGHVDVRVVLGSSPHAQTWDAAWQASADFTVDNYMLLRVAAAGGDLDR